MTTTSSNIYQKLSDARDEFHNLDLKKTGLNKFAGYKYFELGDFLIPALGCLRNHGLVTTPISFTSDLAVLELRELKGDGFIVLTSPMSEASLKGCHPIQNLGAVQTYLRRYLWTNLMEVVEHDALDSSEPLKEHPKAQQAQPQAQPQRGTSTAQPSTTVATNELTPQQKAAKTRALNKAVAEAETVTPDKLETNEDAVAVVDLLLGFAAASKTVISLAGFWKANASLITTIEASFPDEFARLKTTFTELKTNLKEQA